MKKICFCILIYFFVGLTVFAQWQGNGPVYTIDDRVGIGTADPNVELEVHGSLNIGSFSNFGVGKLQIKGAGYNQGLVIWNEVGNNTFRFWVDDTERTAHITRGGDKSNGLSFSNEGLIGVGHSDPICRFTIKHPGTLGLKLENISNAGIAIVNDTETLRLALDSNEILQFGSDLHLRGENGMMFYTGIASIEGYVNPKLRLSKSGNLGIGTTTPNYKLDVNGTIRGKEVIVENFSADYVFKPDYELLSIAEVSTFIAENGHLPDIPSAAEVKQEGVKLGDMNRLLLQKIEELTLYVIELESENDDLQTQNSRWASLFADLEERLSRLEGAPSYLARTKIDN